MFNFSMKDDLLNTTTTDFKLVWYKLDTLSRIDSYPNLMRKLKYSDDDDSEYGEYELKFGVGLINF